jgi:hypothetical protein
MAIRRPLPQIVNLHREKPTLDRLAHDAFAQKAFQHAREESEHVDMQSHG